VGEVSFALRLNVAGFHYIEISDDLSSNGECRDSTNKHTGVITKHSGDVMGWWVYMCIYMYLHVYTCICNYN
jgi:hypothetical protein